MQIHPSVRVSITLWYCIKMNAHIVKLLALSSRGMTLVFLGATAITNFQWNSVLPPEIVMHDAYIGGRSENNIKCVVHDDLGWKNWTTRYILPRHWLYKWFSQFHSCGTYSVLSRSPSICSCLLYVEKFLFDASIELKNRKLVSSCLVSRVIKADKKWKLKLLTPGTVRSSVHCLPSRLVLLFTAAATVVLSQSFIHSFIPSQSMLHSDQSCAEALSMRASH